MKSSQSQVLADMLLSHFDMHGLLLEATGNEPGEINIQDLIVGVLKKYNQEHGSVAASKLASNIISEFASSDAGIDICALGKWTWLNHPNDFDYNATACRVRLGENIIDHGETIEVFRVELDDDEFVWKINAPGLPSFMDFPDSYFTTFEDAANEADRILRENGVGIPGDKLTSESPTHDDNLGGLFDDW
jgi:hypothetical protein